jgi:phosphoglycolate phosphatase
MIRNIILDWSGTLVNDLEAVWRSTNAVLTWFALPVLDRPTFQHEFVLPLRDFYVRLLPDIPFEAIDEIYHRAFEQERDQVELLPAAEPFLASCQRNGRRLFVLSTMRSDHFHAQAERLGVRSYFEKAWVGISDKRTGLRELLATEKLIASETLFAGDMVHDIEAAQANGVLAIALLTGFDPGGKLAAAGPDALVPSLSNLDRLLAQRSTGADQWIEITDLEIKSRIGVPEEERAEFQPLSVTLRFQISPSFRSLTDDVNQTVDYAAVAAAISEVAQASQARLIETLVENLADRIWNLFPLRRLEVELSKFALPAARKVRVRTSRPG